MLPFHPILFLALTRSGKTEKMAKLDYIIIFAPVRRFKLFEMLHSHACLVRDIFRRKTSVSHRRDDQDRFRTDIALIQIMVKECRISALVL